MMKKSFLSIVFLVMVASQSLYAHSGGHDPVSEKEAIFIASQTSLQFIDNDPGLGFGKLNDSWRHLPGSAQTMHKTGEGYYIVSINNKSQNKTLYVLLSVEGEVYDANFSGVFPGLK